jgi:hypothetical protein
MTPGSYDLCLYRGDSARWRFQLWQDDAKTQPADLTGATVLAQIRDRPDGSNIVDLTCTITTPNIIDVALAAGAAVPQRGVWDLQVTYPSGDIVTYLTGRVAMQLDVTHAA